MVCEKTMYIVFYRKLSYVILKLFNFLPQLLYLIILDENLIPICVG